MSSTIRRKFETEIGLGELNVDRTNVCMTAFDLLELASRISDEALARKKAYWISVEKVESRRMLAWLKQEQDE